MRVEGVGQCEGDARSTHQHVGEGQVPDEKVGDVVHLAGAADDVEEQVVAEYAHEGHQGVAGNDEQLEGLEQLHAHKLRAALGGAVLQRHLKDLTCVISIHIMQHHTWRSELGWPATACALHPRRLMSAWRGEIMIMIQSMYTTTCTVIYGRLPFQRYTDRHMVISEISIYIYCAVSVQEITSKYMQFDGN